MLLSSIDKDMFEKLNIGKLFLEKLGDMFGNMLGGILPGQDMGTGEGQEEYSHENVMFEQQSKIGRAKGEMASPEPMRKQIKQFYNIKNNMTNRKSVVVLNDPDEKDTLG